MNNAKQGLLWSQPVTSQSAYGADRLTGIVYSGVGFSGEINTRQNFLSQPVYGSDWLKGIVYSGDGFLGGILNTRQNI